jgi:hypothetical protein
MKLLPPYLFLLLLLCHLHPLSAQDETITPDRTGELIDLIYTVEDFSSRLERAISLNPTIKINEAADDRVYIDHVVGRFRETALSRYGASIAEAYADFTPEEIDALIELLQSDRGDLVRKLIRAEQLAIGPALTAYVDDIAREGVAATLAYDSVLYEREFSFDLQEVMDGVYLDSMFNGRVSRVERRGNTQTERAGEVQFRFNVDWLSNSAYLLSDHLGNPVQLGEPLRINIYAIEHDTFRYIWQNPDGSYDKHQLVKISYTSPEQEARTFQYGLWEEYIRPETSPLPQDSLDAFRERGGLSFYPISGDYRVQATVTRDESGATLSFPTSAGTEVTYAIYGTADFELNGRPQSLTLYRPLAADGTTPGAERLFLPFRDATSNKTTYGGGRYLDLPLPTDGTLILDFNQAYHPYCAYTVGYACPVPPEGNRVGGEVEAGVRF